VTTTLRSTAARGPRPAPDQPPRTDVRADVALVAVVVVGAACGAAAGCHPAGWAPADLVLSAAAAALVTWAAARAATGPRLAMVLAAALLSSGWLRAFALAGVALAVVAQIARARPDRSALFGAAAGAVGVNVLFRLPEAGIPPIWTWSTAPTGMTALLGVAATVPVVVSAWRRSDTVVRRRLRRGTVVVAAYVALATFGFLVAALVGRGPMGHGILYAQKGLDAAERGNQPVAASELEVSSAAFAKAHRDFTAPWSWPARVVPVLGYYAKAASSLSSAGHTVAGAAGEGARRVPYDRITAKPGRVDLDLLRAAVEPVATADAGVRAATAVVDQVDDSWFIPALSRRFDSYREHLDTALPEADRALEAVRLAPDLLGGAGPRRYLVLFGNPAEARMLGGYAGAYGVLTADGGRLTLARSGRTQDLPADPTTPALVSALGWPVAQYAPATHLGNITAAADFPAMAKAATELYQRPLGQHLDGVLYVDPAGLASLLGLVGRVDFDGLPHPLDETNVAAFLLRDQYELFPTRSDRFDFLSDTARATFHLLTTRSLGSPMKIFQQLAPAVRGGHLQLWLDDDRSVRLLDEVGVSGRTDHQREGEVFDLRTSNLSQNKTDAFVHRAVDYETTIDPHTGAIGVDVTIRLHNSVPPGLSPYVESNQWLRARQPGAPPSGSDTLLVSLATTLRAGSASVDGQPIALGAQSAAPGHEPDGAATRYTTTVTILAGETVEIRVHLAGRGGHGHRDTVTVVHQPTANDDRVRIGLRVGGSKRSIGPFTLTETRVVHLSSA
jgi:hypothetical protein